VEILSSEAGELSDELSIEPPESVSPESELVLTGSSKRYDLYFAA
jgi:hypothetical protein